MAQTAATACASLSALGFASGLLAMSEESYKVAGGAELEGNKLGPGNTVELTYGLCVAWCFAVAFIMLHRVACSYHAVALLAQAHRYQV